MSDYELSYHTPAGRRVALLGGSSAANAQGDVLGLTYTNTVNAPGWATLTVRRGAIPDRWLVPDCQIAIMRGGRLEGECRWIVRLFDEDETADVVMIGAEASIGLLDTRTVAAYAGGAGALKDGPADDVMKAFVREQLGSSAASGRALTTASVGYPFQVAADAGLGPTIHKAASRAPLLQTLQEIAQDAATKGAFIAFDVVWTGALYEFRTYVGRRGRNRGPGSARPLIFQARDLSGLRTVRDYRNERTFVYGLGQGTGASRDVATAEDTTQTGRSSIGRRELSAEDTRVDLGDSDALQAVADSRLRASRALRATSATIDDTSAYRYGVHWDFGDEVGIQRRSGAVSTARIDSRTVTIGPQGDQVAAQLREEG